MANVLNIYKHLRSHIIKKKKAPRDCLLGLSLIGCWTTRIRTWTNRTKTCCATITP